MQISFEIILTKTIYMINVLIKNTTLHERLEIITFQIITRKFLKGSLKLQDIKQLNLSETALIM